MKAIIHKASTRGTADYGWLKATYSFSFARWFNPARVQFGALRVLNDDSVAPGMGFGTHPHDNMEIISIPLEGAVAHKDSMGSTETIRKNDIQVMSAGTGITHSEFNPSSDEYLKMLQIWIFPRERNLKPRYEQRTYSAQDRVNQWQMIVSPDAEGDSLMINQDAWLYRTRPQAGTEMTLNLHTAQHGAYVFVIDGSIELSDGQLLSPRDAAAVTDTKELKFKALENAEVPVTEAAAA